MAAEAELPRRPTPRPTTPAELADGRSRRLALRGRRVVLGVSGGIAAYKAVEICRRLVDAGAFVSPVLTEDATRFIGALTFSALASEPARTTLFDAPRDPIPHTRLGQSRRPLIVAPATTAQLLGKYAGGHLRRPPQRHAARDPGAGARRARRCTPRCGSTPRCRRTSRRCAAGASTWCDPESGRLAGGDVGAGRLAAPERSWPRPRTCSPRQGDLAGVRVLVTAGGTREAIDPVRFVGNRSSGKMGYAVAEPGRGPRRGGHARHHHTGRARRASRSCGSSPPRTCTARCSAASTPPTSSSWPPRSPTSGPRPTAGEKLKKRDGLPEIVLEPTPDILAALGATQAGPGAGRLRGRDRAGRGARGREARRASAWTSSWPTT